MATVTFNNKEYEIENLSEDTKRYLASFQFVQNEMKRMEAQMAVYKTAEKAYLSAIEDNIDKS